jgi:hypothetical protein
MKVTKIVTGWGDQYWKNKNKKYHRVGDLPAVILPDGTQKWYKDGKRHRIHGAAMIWKDETEWRINLMVSYED